MAVRRVAGGSGKTRKTLQFGRRSDKRQRKGYVKTESDFLVSATRFTKEGCFLEGSQTSPVCPSDKSGMKMRMRADIDGVILTGESRNTGRKTFPSATFGTTDLKWSDLGSNPRLRCDIRRLSTA